MIFVLVCSKHSSELVLTDPYDIYMYVGVVIYPCKSNRKAMNRNWSTQKANPALETKTGNK